MRHALRRHRQKLDVGAPLGSLRVAEVPYALTAQDPLDDPSPASAPGRLSTLDRFLPVWSGAAMVAGLLLGRRLPGLGGALSAVEVDGVSLPIALGCW